jgi:hypothetical protein
MEDTAIRPPELAHHVAFFGLRKFGSLSSPGLGARSGIGIRGFKSLLCGYFLLSIDCPEERIS